MSRKHRHKHSMVQREDGTFEVSINSFLKEYCPYTIVKKKKNNGNNGGNNNNNYNKNNKYNEKNNKHSRDDRHTIHIKQIEPDELLDNAFNNYMKEVLNKEDK